MLHFVLFFSAHIQEVILLVGVGLGVSQYSCNTLIGIITIENAAIHHSGTAHAFAALAANSKFKDIV